MKENEADDNKFTWNDLVKIKEEAPVNLCLGEVVVICGITKVNTKYLAEKYSIGIGSWIYTVEFGNGSSMTIPEKYLEKYNNCR